MNPTPRCRICSASDPRRLIVLVETAGLHRTTYVCRPSAPFSRECWLSVGPRDAERIVGLLQETPEDRQAFALAAGVRCPAGTVAHGPAPRIIRAEDLEPADLTGWRNGTVIATATMTAYADGEPGEYARLRSHSREQP